jgi:hypothetical protein
MYCVHGLLCAPCVGLAFMCWLRFLRRVDVLGGVCLRVHAVLFSAGGLFLPSLSV